MLPANINEVRMRINSHLFHVILALTPIFWVLEVSSGEPSIRREKVDRNPASPEISLLSSAKLRTLVPIETWRLLPREAIQSEPTARNPWVGRAQFKAYTMGNRYGFYGYEYFTP